MNIAEEVAQLEKQQNWDRLFRDIKVKAAQYNLSYKDAKLPDNRNKNRYRDVSPYDHSRVKLIEGPNDYINSNLVKVAKADRRYILSQGPLPCTSGQLWQMVWEQKSKSVIMLNKTIEKGTRKCDQYWPLNKDKPKIYEEDGYKVDLISEMDKSNFIIRELELTKLNDGELRRIFQFHYTAWPDFGVPESPTAFLDFLECVREHRVLENTYGPAVIHCSAGIGRSGTFALVDTCLVFLEKGIQFDIKDTLLDMRTYRMGLIQTPQQLRFSYLAIAECERILKHKKIDVTRIKDVNQAKENDDDSDDDDTHHNQTSTPFNGDCSPGNDNAYTHESNTDEGRKRHGEPNGPTDEKRGKQEQVTEPQPSGVTLTPESFHTTTYMSEMKPSDNHLPMCHTSDISSPELLIDNNNRKDYLRHRKIEERKRLLKKQVEDIKNNMKASESNWPWKHYVFGGIVTAVVVGMAIRYWYHG